MKMWWIIVLVWVAEAGAQTGSDSAWVRPFGGRDEDAARVIRAVPEGGYLLAGTVTDVFAGAILLVRIDSAGRVLWRRRIDEPRSVDVRDVQVLADGYIVAGIARASTENEYPFLLRLDGQGQTVWTQVYADGAHGGVYAVRALEDGGFALAGWAMSAEKPQMDVLLMQTDSAGGRLWSRTYGGEDDEWAADLCVTADGFALAVQVARPMGIPDEVGLLRSDTLGTLVGLRRHAVENLGWVQAIVPAPTGGFAIAWSRRYIGWWEDETAGLDRLDSAGELLWREVYLAADHVESRLMLRPVEFGFVLMGYAVSLGGGARSMHTLRIDPDGGLRSTHAFDGLGYARWKRKRYYWHYEVADAFGPGLTDYFTVSWDPPKAAIAVLPDAPVPERPRRHARFDSFSNVYQVRFQLTAREQVTIRLLDTAGRLVKIFACGDYPSGDHFEVIDGWALPSGIYFLHVDTGEAQLTRKVVFVR